MFELFEIKKFLLYKKRLEINRCNESINDMLNISKIHKNNYHLYNDLGILYLNKDYHFMARKYFKKALSIKNNFVSNYGLCISYYYNENFNKAYEYANDLFTIINEDKDNKIGLSYDEYNHIRELYKEIEDNLIKNLF